MIYSYTRFTCHIYDYYFIIVHFDGMEAPKIGRGSGIQNTGIFTRYHILDQMHYQIWFLQKSHKVPSATTDFHRNCQLLHMTFPAGLQA